MDLNILPLSSVQPVALQKCLIPCEKFPDSIRPGHVAKCRTTSGMEYICRVYPMDNVNPRNYCALDEKVMSTKSCEILDKPKLMEIEKLEDIGIVDKIEISITVNNELFTLFKVTRNLLVDSVRNLIRPLYLINGCTITMDEWGKSIGLTSVIVGITRKLTESQCFKINEKTVAILKSIQMEKLPNLRYTNLKGLQKTQEELNKLTINMDEIIASRFCPTSNILLIGPTGSGKTSLCHNFFLDHKCNVFEIKPGNIFSQNPGESEANLRKIFSNAQMFQETFHPKDPIIIFIEDIDLLCPTRTHHSKTSCDNFITEQLVTLLDNLKTKKNTNLKILATTSRIELVNSILRCPGRFDREINVPNLSQLERLHFVRSFFESNLTNEENIDELCESIAKRTQGFVGGDITNLMQKVLLTKFKDKEQNLVNIIEAVLKTVKSTSIQNTDVSVYKSEEKFNSLGGLGQLKSTLKASVIAGLKNPAAFSKFGLTLPKGILLYGPPGCAKTKIAKCLASEANMTFIATSGAEVYSPYVGVAEKFISKIFDTARKNSPCLILFDEIDTLVGKRSTNSSSDVQMRILSTLLTEMDGIGIKMHEASGVALSTENAILVVGATNRPDMIDDALLRPGRFDKLIHVPAPDIESRWNIFNVTRKSIPFDENVNIQKLAVMTENFSGADICCLCNEAALAAFTRDPNAQTVNMNDFENVLKNAKASLTKEQIQNYIDYESKNKKQ